MLDFCGLRITYRCMQCLNYICKFSYQVLCTVTFDSLDTAAKSDPVSVITG